MGADMSTDPILKLCKILGLSAFAQAYNRQMNEPSYDDTPFCERLEELLTEELNKVRDKRVLSLVSKANMRFPHSYVEDIDYMLYAKLNASKIKGLAKCSWVNKKQHVLITGPKESGKTMLACALANEAIEQLIPVVCYPMAKLLLELVVAQKENQIQKITNKINRSHLLVIDSWDITSISNEERYLVFDLIMSRNDKSSLIITSQTPVSNWYKPFPRESFADTALNYVIHKSHIIELKNGSIPELLDKRNEVEGGCDAK